MRSGVIPNGSPAAAAAFLREHAARLDKGQVGELFGHHEDHSIAVSYPGEEDVDTGVGFDLALVEAQQLCPMHRARCPTLSTHAQIHPQVMHAYIDGERFSGLSLDEALRQLLQGFRCGWLKCYMWAG